MQTPHIQLIPIAALLLFSMISCSSETETSQKSLALTGDGLFSGDPVTRDNDTQTNSPNINSGVADIGLSLNSSNYEQIAKGAVQAINLTELNNELDNARTLLFDLNASGWALIAGESGLPGLTLASQENVPGEYSQGDYSQTFTCDEGGLLTVELRDVNDGPFYHHRASFDNCHLNGQSHNGSLESSGARRSPDLTIFRNYSRTTSGQGIVITGEHVYAYPFFGNVESNTWTDTGVVVTNSTGTVKIDNINWHEEGADAPQPHPDTIAGFVLLPDGIIKRVAQFNYATNLRASFNFTPAQAQGDGIAVNVNLNYGSEYFNWEGHYESGFELPSFPVSDLGTTIDLYSEYDIYAGTSQLFDSQPKDPAPQWQDGQIRITAPDSTSLVMRPDSNNADALSIELNGSGELIPKLWVDGYQVICPSGVGGCS